MTDLPPDRPTLVARASAWRAAAIGLGAVACFFAGMLSAPSRPDVTIDACPEAAPTPDSGDPTASGVAPPASRVGTDDPPEIGQSIGAPRAGALNGGARLRPGDGYLLRNPITTFGTVETVAHIERAIATARTAFPELHPVLVGDLSSELGGMLLGHRSHQSGRDVDIGMLYRRRPAGFPQRFTDATVDNLHVRGTLALVKALADTAGQPGGVEWILLDYSVQKILRRYAEREGMPTEELDRLFQVPHGPTAPQGLLRHFPGHRNHLHVRFGCPPGDPFCASPAGPPQERDPGRGPRSSVPVPMPERPLASAR